MNKKVKADRDALLEACKAGLAALVSVYQSEFETKRNRHPEDGVPEVKMMRDAIAKAESI